MDTTTVLYSVSALLMLVGLAGTVLPALPGMPILFGGMLLAAWAGDFEHVGGWTLALLGGLCALAIALDFIAGLLGAKRVGASGLALFGAALGVLVGLFFGLVGLVLGPFVGAMLGELAAGRQAADAAKVGLGTWIGMALGAVAKVGIGFVMLGLFWFALLV
jgi:uncharacterized protein YqgC (DUF456 family)